MGESLLNTNAMDRSRSQRTSFCTTKKTNGEKEVVCVGGGEIRYESTL